MKKILVLFFGLLIFVYTLRTKSPVITEPDYLGDVYYIQGRALLNGLDAQVGDLLKENTVASSNKNSIMTLELLPETVLKVGPNSTVTISKNQLDFNKGIFRYSGYNNSLSMKYITSKIEKDSSLVIVLKDEVSTIYVLDGEFDSHGRGSILYYSKDSFKTKQLTDSEIEKFSNYFLTDLEEIHSNKIIQKIQPILKEIQKKIDSTLLLKEEFTPDRELVKGYQDLIKKDDFQSLYDNLPMEEKLEILHGKELDDYKKLSSMLKESKAYPVMDSNGKLAFFDEYPEYRHLLPKDKDGNVIAIKLDENGEVVGTFTILQDDNGKTYGVPQDSNGEFMEVPIINENGDLEFLPMVNSFDKVLSLPQEDNAGIQLNKDTKSIFE
jgi:hypothetical protein